MRAVLSCITLAATLAFVTAAVATRSPLPRGPKPGYPVVNNQDRPSSGKCQMIRVPGLEYWAWNTWNRLANE